MAPSVKKTYPMKPAAGVMATRPAIAPVQKPTTDHLRSMRQSMNIHARPPVEAAVLVVAADENIVLVIFQLGLYRSQTGPRASVKAERWTAESKLWEP